MDLPANQVALLEALAPACACRAPSTGRSAPDRPDRVV